MSQPPVVLLVEDNASMRALIRSLVEQVTPAVHECGDGASALDAYTRVNPDLVLMDVRMGVMDGIAATRAIRTTDPGALVIIVTERGEDAVRQAAQAAGASGFLLKQDLLELPALVAQRVGAR